MPSKIQWTDETWSPIVGCTKCSPGCLNCYAERMAYRLWCMGNGAYGSVMDIETNGWNGEVFCRKDRLEIPLHWRKPRRIFVCSMSDLFHLKVPFEFIDKVFALATLCPQHTFLMLTKRIDRALEYVLQEPRGQIDHAITNGLTHFVGRGKKYAGKGLTKHLRNKTQLWPLPNVHFGASISNQPEADKIIPILLQIPAAVRWLSIEPMLGAIDISLWLGLVVAQKEDAGYRLTHYEEKGKPYPYEKSPIGWVVCGGESGPGARPMHPNWPRGVRDQCVAANVPYFFKQHGEFLHESQGADTDGPINAGGDSKKGYVWPDVTWSIRVGKKKAGCLLDGKEWKQYPK